MNRTPIRRRADAGYTHPGSELTADEVEFGLAMDEFQRRYRVRYPAWSEILFVLHTLGYRKAVRAEDVSALTPNPSPSETVLGEDGGRGKPECQPSPA